MVRWRKKTEKETQIGAVVEVAAAGVTAVRITVAEAATVAKAPPPERTEGEREDSG